MESAVVRASLSDVSFEVGMLVLILLSVVVFELFLHATSALNLLRCSNDSAKVVPCCSAG